MTDLKIKFNIRVKFGHYYTNKNSFNYTYHVRKDKISRCNFNLDLCFEQICIDDYFRFKNICKRCWKMLNKKEQEELIHYFCVKKLKE